MVIRRRINNCGLSLLAIVGTICALTITLTALTPVIIKVVKLQYAVKAARQIRFMQDSSKEYYATNGVWPTSITDLKSDGYINANWDGKDPWGHDYGLAGDASGFSVTCSGIPDEDSRIAVASSLPFTESAGNSVISTVPLMGEESSMLPLVHRSGLEERRTMAKVLITPGVNTQTYYKNLNTTGIIRLKDYYMEDMSLKEDGSCKGIYLSDYKEFVEVSVE